MRKIYGFRDLFIGDPYKMNIDLMNYLKYKDIKKIDYNNILSREIQINDTTFLVVADDHDNMIGFIQSLFYPFGSGVVVKGITFQNRGSGFVYRKDLSNSPERSKRLLHILSILHVRDDKKRLMIGCAGGDLRPQVHVRIFENIFIYSMNLCDVISSPRFIYTRYYDKPEVLIENYLKPLSTEDLAIEYRKKLVEQGL